MDREKAEKLANDCDDMLARELMDIDDWFGQFKCTAGLLLVDFTIPPHEFEREEAELSTQCELVERKLQTVISCMQMVLRMRRNLWLARGGSSDPQK